MQAHRDLLRSQQTALVASRVTVTVNVKALKEDV